MLGRGVESKGREAAGISSGWESLQHLHVFSNITRKLQSTCMKGKWCSQHSSSAAAIPQERSHALISC